MKATLFVAVLALVMASAAPTTASVPTTITVAEGETIILAGTVTADSILIAGTVQAVGDLSLTADTITLTDTARVHGADGLPGASVVADSATAGDGGAGGSLTLSARVLTIADGAHVQGGSGGAGGNALGTSLAVGGLGGDGGGIYLHAQSTSIDAVLLPGAGGDGGHATAQVGPAHGGAGGDSGTAYLNGALFLQDIPDVLAPQSSDSKLPLETLPAIHIQPPPKCQQGECPLDNLGTICESPNKPAECVPPIPTCEIEEDSSSTNDDCIPPLGCLPDCPWVSPDICQPLCNLDVGVCGDAGAPVSPIIKGNGGSWFQLYQDKASDGTVFGKVYVSFSLQTNNINNGADEWNFGYELTGMAGDTEYRLNGAIDSSFAHCLELGLHPFNFDYFIDAGAAGWTSHTECTAEANWRVQVGASFTLKDAGVSTEVELGGSYSCSDGSSFDSESLLRGRGSSS